MPNDELSKRFAMIMQEMAGDVEPRVTSPASILKPGKLLNDGTGFTCSLCGFGAFEPVYVKPGFGGSISPRPGPGRVPKAVCRGCPPPSPIYELPNGLVELAANRYACESCGKQSQVTMTSSETWIYCGGCGGLTIHYKQLAASLLQLPDQGRLVDGVMIDEKGWVDPALLFKLEQRVAYPKPNQVIWSNQVLGQWSSNQEDREQSVFVDEVNDVYLPSDNAALVELTKTMMSILGLIDFDEYAERVRRLPSASGDRRTGRTTRGIVELMARYYLSSTLPVVWVLSSTTFASAAWLRNQVRDVRDRLGNSHPKKIEVAPPAWMLRDQLRPPDGVMLLVDHTYYEQRTKRTR